ncbi:1-deoxy-D-xylulose 5-phosphate reductoisomerase [Ruminococcaceae bacterium YRB3002]|nr:1-deoxy-D-xylulose 5-phosphate reductoisomerase [Ruminococcaceae bacterium YRB3002]
MRYLSILGCTGSIGTQTLEVCRNNPGDFKVVGLSCGSNTGLLLDQILEFRPVLAAVSDEVKAEELRRILKEEHKDITTEVITGSGCNITVATMDECDTVVGAMVGIAGLEPTYRAILKGKDIALANKETLVTGGEVIMPLVAPPDREGVHLLPVDSEHCAIWQCLWGERRENLDRILITASGGPFRGRSRQELEGVTLSQALNHPTWKMGGKITIDSATMMNKGLEVIEARHLFSVTPDRIDVVVHPQSVIHSMIRMRDGSVLAQMGKPSMILPIMVALYYPDRGPELIEDFDPFAAGINNLTFERCDTDVFGLLKLAYEVGTAGGLLPTVMNAANEVAVGRFLKDEIGFLDIERVVKGVCDKMSGISDGMSIDSILACDREARQIAEGFIRGL